MRTLLTGFLAVVMTASLAAQTPPQRPPRRPITRGGLGAGTAEGAVKAAMDQLGELKKAFDRDIEVLRHVRAADAALTDPTQPHNAVEKAYEEISKAESLNTEPLVEQGLIRTRQTIDEARRSPMTADFGRLRSILKEQAEGPSSRLVVRNAGRLQDEVLAWLRVQELVTLHVRTLSEMAADGLQVSVE